MVNQRGVIHLVVPLLLLLILGVLLVGLLATGIIKFPLKSIPSLPGIAKQEANVTLQKQYQNPFDNSAQYVNPFSEVKNPFDLLKK